MQPGWSMCSGTNARTVASPSFAFRLVPASRKYSTCRPRRDCRSLGGVPTFGFGTDALRVHCTMESEVIRLHLPSDEEILEEVLFEAGIRPVHDEKRAVYRPALERFSGLNKAAHHFKRRLRQVIRVLRGFDLRLMSWGDGSGVPTRGTYLVILGTANDGLLHIRIFDGGGNCVTDADETRLPDPQSGAITALKQQLPGLLPPHKLTEPRRTSSSPRRQRSSVKLSDGIAVRPISRRSSERRSLATEKCPMN